MKRPIVIALLAGVLIGVFGSIARADVSAQQVREAIDRAVGYLKQQQRNDGSWREWVNQPGGVTGLCTLALLNAGVEPDDPHIQRALAYLRKLRPKATYSAALQTMVFCKAGYSTDKGLIARNVKWFESTQVQQGPRKGAWSYGHTRSSGDNSNAQFALLALHEDQRAGVEVSSQTWRGAKRYWQDCQNVDGSWGYYKGVGGTGSMTCAGIASLIITADKVRESDAETVGNRIQCCRRGAVKDDRLDRALQWLGRNFSVTRNPGGPGQGWLLYYLYGVERVGRLTARRFIGKHDWYRIGSEYLVSKQDNLSGFFKGAGHAENNPVIGTSLALLFLSKGRRPVLMAKLQRGAADDWNQHRSDVDNLARYVESRWELDLTWQVTNLRMAEVDDLLQSPVLYFCGNRSPLPRTAGGRRDLARKLRDYLDRGGFLFAEGYCGGTGFDEGFRELVRLIFPEPEYRLQLLEPEHPIWRAEEKIPADQLRPLWGIEFGCRTSVVYAPRNPPGDPRPSLSCLWELARGGRERKYTPVVQRQIDAALALGTNILAYATNRELKGKEQSFRTRADRQLSDPFERGKLYIAKLRHGGGCNAAPRALINLLDTAGRELKVRTRPKVELLALTDEALFDYHLVFMHGRNAFRLTDSERRQLKTYVERGGMLMADSICASSAFTASFRREMALTFPRQEIQPIAADDPLLTPTYGGYDLKTVERRDPRPRGGGPLKATVRRVAPQLEGIRLGDRWGVIFSPYDISCALEKHDSLECRGYTREDAARIALNVLLYSLQQ